MKPRQGMVAIFSTFLRLEGDQVAGWITSPALKRSMTARLQDDPQNESENFWVLYWHRQWQQQPNPLAEAHLAAHLQETCYWAARKMTLGFADRAALADFFQIAIARVPRLLKSFDSRYSQSFKGYAELVFKNSLKDWLRVQQKVAVCTDWALLYRLSRKRLLEALRSTALSQLTLQQYVFAWECFRELVAIEPSEMTALNRPDAQTWQAIAAAYNANRLSQVDASAPASSPEQLEQWLLNSAKAVREWLQPTVISADAPLTGGHSSNLLDTVPDELQKTPLGVLLNQEEERDRQTQLAQLTHVLAASLAALDAEALMLLHAYYSQDLTQTEIAKQLGMKQFQVSRQLERLRRSLLKKVAQWSQDTLHISPTPDVVDAMSRTLEEWLSQTLKAAGETQA